MTKTNNNKTREIKTGINGRGQKIWCLFTNWTDDSGRSRQWIERFDTKAEAEHFARWS